MKLGDILMRAGSAIFKSVIPGGGLIVDMVNGFLPDEKKIPNEATGEQISQAVSTLSPDLQAQILSEEIDVELAEISSWTRVQGSLAEADKVGASTRPQIALMMAKVVSFVIISFSTMWIVAIIQNHVDMIKVLTDSWMLVLAIIGTPIALLRAYFGMRSKEKKERYGAAMGQPTQPNLISSILWAIRK